MLEVIAFIVWCAAFGLLMAKWKEDELAQMRRAERLYRRQLRRMS